MLVRTEAEIKEDIVDAAIRLWKSSGLHNKSIICKCVEELEEFRKPKEVLPPDPSVSGYHFLVYADDAFPAYWNRETRSWRTCRGSDMHSTSAFIYKWKYQSECKPFIESSKPTDADIRQIIADTYGVNTLRVNEYYPCTFIIAKAVRDWKPD